jgi:hypothetical protein
MPRKAEPRMVQTKETFTGTIDELPFVARAGETFPEDHPIALAHPQFFGPVKADNEDSAARDPEHIVF